MKMERKRSKFMYEFLPYNTFNHAHCNISGRFTNLWPAPDPDGGTQDISNDIPPHYIVRRVKRHVRRWPNSEDIIEEYNDPDIITPGAASYIIFPRQFECDSCRSVTSFRNNNIDHITQSNADDKVICGNPRCGKPLSDREQLPFVAICPCGQIQEPFIPTCCGAGMKFGRPTTRMSDWYFQCVNPSCSEGKNGGRKSFPFVAINTRCFGCEENDDMEIINHTANSAFYAKTKSLVNVQPSLDTLHHDEQYQREIVSDYLAGESLGESVSQEEVRDRAQDLIENRGLGFKEAFEQAEDELDVSEEDHRQQTAQWLNTEFDDETAMRLAEQLYEFLSITDSAYAPQDGMQTTTFSGLREEVEQFGDEADTHLSLPVLRSYENIREAMKFGEVRLIEDFPLTTVTYGYTRTAAEPAEFNDSPEDEGAEYAENDTDETEDDETLPVQLNIFDTADDFAGTQLFIQKTKAEAVQIQLAHAMVVRWLAANDFLLDEHLPGTYTTVTTAEVESDDGRDLRPEEKSLDEFLSNEEDVKRWLLKKVTAPGRWEELEPDVWGSDAELARAIYVLLHSFSHALIRTIGALAGHQKESLVEHPLPHTLSVIIYKRADTDFALGSIFTLFEERFNEVAEYLLREASECSLDPVCSHDEEAACEDCMYLAALTCSNANLNLSRSPLYGGEFDEQTLTGYFNNVDLDIPSTSILSDSETGRDPDVMAN